MPGYEELTPEQIIYIVNILSATVLISTILLLIRSIVTWKVSKNIKKLELIIENKIDNGIKKPTAFDYIKSWWNKRKLKKAEKELY